MTSPVGKTKASNGKTSDETKANHATEILDCKEATETTTVRARDPAPHAEIAPLAMKTTVSTGNGPSRTSTMETERVSQRRKGRRRRRRRKSLLQPYLSS